jgi:multidrug efflux pump subunit AcrA (membrane-fusion protein)
MIALRGRSFIFMRSALMVPTLTLLALAGCSAGGEESEAEATPVVAVRTAVVSEQPFTETVGAIGAVTARPGHVASLGAPTATRVTNVYVSEGARVSRGQPLVALDRTAIDAAAQASEAALTAAQQAFERAQRLNREGVAPRKDVEQASADLGRARSEAIAARRASQLAVLHSPIAGVVTRLAAVLGASVDVNQPLVEVADPSALDIVLSVTPAEAGARDTERQRLPVRGSEGRRRAVRHRDRDVRRRGRRFHDPRRSRARASTEHDASVAHRRDAVRAYRRRHACEGARGSARGTRARWGRIQGVRRGFGEHRARAARDRRRAQRLDGGDPHRTRGGQRVVTYGAYGVDDSVKVTTAAPGAARVR